MPSTKRRSPPGGATEQVRISALSYGPHGIGRLPTGKVAFVRGVVPGEDVEIAVREDHKSFAYADLVAVLAPSPQRRNPPCRYLPACGGCPWQHMTYDAQLRAKEESVRDALTRIGKIDAEVVRPILPSPLELGYRNRLNLRVDHGEVGFYRGGTHDLVPIEHCLLAEEQVDRAIAHARNLVRRIESRIRRVEVVARGSKPGVVLHAEVEGELHARGEHQVLAFLETFTEVSGVALQGRKWRAAWGDVTIDVTATDDASITQPAGAFSQVNPQANRLLVELVLGFCDLGERDRLLELHAGAGNFTVPLARRAGRMVAVEQNETAAAAAAANTSAMQNVEVRNESAAQAVERAYARGERFDVVLLDPPRSGAAEVLHRLLDLAPQRIVYVSCNPSTLARDLGRLQRRYRIEAVQPIDMFPHTYHVESVVRSVLT